MSLSQNRNKFCSQGKGESSQGRSFESHESRATTCYDEKAPLEEARVYVVPVVKKDNGSRSYNKKHHCVYCGILVQKMSRHLLRKHMDKVEVATACSLPKNSKQRRLQLDYLRNKENFEHNIAVLESNQGETKGENRKRSIQTLFLLLWTVQKKGNVATFPVLQIQASR